MVNKILNHLLCNRKPGVETYGSVRVCRMIARKCRAATPAVQAECTGDFCQEGISHTDSSGSPLRVRVLDYADGGRQCTQHFRTVGSKNYPWRCVRAGRVENEDESRASLAVWRCRYPDGHQTQKNTMAGARDEDAIDSCPTRKVLVSDPFSTRRRGAQRARWLDQVESNLSEIGCSRGGRTAAQDRVSWKRIGDLAMSTRRART